MMSNFQRFSWRRLSPVALLLMAVLGLVLRGSPASAASTLYVGPGGGTGGCAAPAFNDIQAAVTTAASGDTVRICAGTYTLAAPVIIGAKDLSFVGDGASTTTIDGANSYQLLNAVGRAVSVSGITFQHARSTTDGGAITGDVVDVTSCGFYSNVVVSLVLPGPAVGLGGAIFASGHVTVAASTFSGNSASGGGGAVFSWGSISVVDSSLIGNSAAYYGGALNTASAVLSGATVSGNSATFGAAVAAHTASVTNSTFEQNRATDGGALYIDTATITGSSFDSNAASNIVSSGPTSGLGGAIFASQTVTLGGSTLKGNTATGGGGGVFAWGSVTATSSTFAENSAGYYGGALNTGTLVLANSTLYANAGGFGGAVAAHSATVTNATFSENTAATGGALYVDTAGVTNSIFAHSPAPNCTGAITSAGGNFSSDSSCGTPAVALAVLHLGSLGANGGPTQTFGLLAGSVAIDAGLDAACAASGVNGLDQRGTSRPQGSHCDSGAFEYVLPVSQTITFEALPDVLYGVAPLQLIATSSSNLGVSFATTPNTVCTVNGPEVTIVAAGSCTLTADQPGDATYAPADQVQRSFIVNPAPVHVVAPSVTVLLKSLVGNAPLPATAVGGNSLDRGSFLCTTSAPTTGTPARYAAVGGYPVTCAGVGTSPNYSYAYTAGTLSVVYANSGFLSDGENSKWKTGSTVSVRFVLTDAMGVRITDASARDLLAGSCRVVFSAAPTQVVAPTCVKYDSEDHKFSYSWKVSKGPYGPETITVTISYPGTAVTTTIHASSAIVK